MIEKKSKGKFLTYEHRKIIKSMLDNNTKIKDIAEEIGACQDTIYKEIKRGTVNGEYNPDYSEQLKESYKSKKGLKPKISSEHDLADLISRLILEEKLSPERIIEYLKENEPKWGAYLKSRNTIYSAIDKGLIPGVTRENLYLNKNITNIFSDGYLRFPKWFIEEMNIRYGDIFRFEKVDDEQIILTRVRCK